MPHTNDAATELAQTYNDRNFLAMAFARLAHDLGYEVGTRDTDHWEWPVVVVQLPTGEVGWHVPRKFVQAHKPWLPTIQTPYNGYSRKAKNRRLHEFTLDGLEEADDPVEVADL